MIYDALDYFKLLGADATTGEQELKQKYRQAAKFWHPDVNKSPEAIENFQKLSKAFDLLKDEKSKMIYMILSLVYDKNTFVDMKGLKIYHDAKGNETPFLRVFHIQKINRGKVETLDLIGTYEDCIAFLKTAAWHNIKHGLFSPLLYRVFKHNLSQIQVSSKDNFKLLVHNAAAFYHEGKFKAAYLSALGAYEQANTAQKEVLAFFMKSLGVTDVKIEKWDLKKMRAVQLKPFYRMLQFAGGICVLAAVILFVDIKASNEAKKVNYYQEVHFSSGENMADDRVASKVFNIPVDLSDDKMLYHITDAQNVMFGPSEKYDVLQKAKIGQTVRVTGYTPDEVWYRVMLDNGQMGFVKKQYLKPGVKLEIPAHSKIIAQ